MSVLTPVIIATVMSQAIDSATQDFYKMRWVMIQQGEGVAELLCALVTGYSILVLLTSTSPTGALSALVVQKRSQGEGWREGKEVQERMGATALQGKQP